MLGRAAPAAVLGRGGSQAAAESSRYGGTIGRVYVYVRRSGLADGGHENLDCETLKKDLEEHAKYVKKIYDDIDKCDDGPDVCSSEELAKLFGELSVALKDQADALEEYARKCPEPVKLLG